MLRDGTYKEAQELTPDDSLMPGYFDTAPVRDGMNPYLRVMQPATGEYAFVHHIADAFNAERGIAPKFSSPFVRHHKNFNRFDNRPASIERMEFLAHLHLHAAHAREMWEDMGFRAIQRAGVLRYYARNPHARQSRRERMAAQNRHPSFRQVNGQRIAPQLRARDVANPELRAEVSERMRLLWEDG